MLMHLVGIHDLSSQRSLRKRIHRLPLGHAGCGRANVECTLLRARASPVAAADAALRMPPWRERFRMRSGRRIVVVARRSVPAEASDGWAAERGPHARGRGRADGPVLLTVERAGEVASMLASERGSGNRPTGDAGAPSWIGPERAAGRPARPIEDPSCGRTRARLHCRRAGAQRHPRRHCQGSALLGLSFSAPVSHAHGN